MIRITDYQLHWYREFMSAAGTITSEDGRSESRTTRIGYLLKHAQARFQAIQQEDLAPLGLNGRLLAVLAEAAEHGPVLQQRIGDRLGVDRTTMVALIDDLEAVGYVERRSDPSDRRGRLVHVTPQGREALVAGLKASDGIERTFLASLAPADRELFRAMLANLI
jgi:DNA-binding MarR family transcriptional regulator